MHKFSRRTYPKRVSFSELLYLAEALPSRLIYGARGFAAHAKTVTVRILHIHFPDAPGHIRRRLADGRATLLVFFMKRIHILHENGHPHARLSLPTFRQENFYLTARDTTEGRRVSPVPLLAETQLVDVVVHRRGEILNIQNWDYTFEFVHISAPTWMRPPAKPVALSRRRERRPSPSLRAEATSFAEVASYSPTGTSRRRAVADLVNSSKLECQRRKEPFL